MVPHVRGPNKLRTTEAIGRTSPFPPWSDGPFRARDERGRVVRLPDLAPSRDFGQGGGNRSPAEARAPAPSRETQEVTMRGLKQRTTPSDEFVATCSVCGAALRHVHVLHGRSGPRCSFCGSPLVSATPNGRPPRPVAEDEGPLGLLTDFERPRRTSGRVLVTVSVVVLIAVAAVAFVR